ncbi:hypothetical protein BHE74_00000856 [Ensete ventricosum]|nr:hypothetical protein BHE74_00000856 [Ensete ventricosum]
MILISCSQLSGKSLIEANQSFLEKHKDKKLDAIMLIEDSKNTIAMGNDALGPVNIWKRQDCIAVHKLLEDVFKDHGSASSKDPPGKSPPPDPATPRVCRRLPEARPLLSSLFVTTHLLYLFGSTALGRKRSEQEMSTTETGNSSTESEVSGLDYEETQLTLAPPGGSKSEPEKQRGFSESIDLSFGRPALEAHPKDPASGSSDGPVSGAGKSPASK